MLHRTTSKVPALDVSIPGEKKLATASETAPHNAASCRFSLQGVSGSMQVSNVLEWVNKTEFRQLGSFDLLFAKILAVSLCYWQSVHV